MNYARDPHGDSSGVTPSVAMQLFSAILGSNAHPIDRLAARCAAPDGSQWSGEVLAKHHDLPKSIDGWIAWKNAAKSGIHKSDLHASDPAALAAFLEYFVAIVGALAHDGTLITKISHVEIRRGLNLIGPAIEPRWREMFSLARTRLDQIPDETEGEAVD